MAASGQSSPKSRYRYRPPLAGSAASPDPHHREVDHLRSFPPQEVVARDGECVLGGDAESVHRGLSLSIVNWGEPARLQNLAIGEGTKWVLSCLNAT
jgi:hypothetical protein